MKFLSLFLCLAFLLTSANVFAAPADKDAVLSALFESDIASAREALDQGLITCVELTEYFLERIEAYNQEFNCFITLCDNALEEAAKRDELLASSEEHSMLLGIPIVVKDNIDYEGYPTSDGHWTYGAVAWESATVVQNLLDAGAVILGKTNMSTEAQEAQFTASDAIGETPNAYDTTLSAGGSSGGSAVSVSLNFCYAGLGTDTNASLRYPAVLNGCITMRSTKGLMDRDGILILNGTRDVPGTITRSVADQAIVLGEMAGVDYYSNLNANALEGKRIGVLQELCYNETALTYRRESKMDSEIKTVFEETVNNLRSLGATVIPVSIPDIYTLVENCEYNSPYAIEQYMSEYEELFAERKLDALVFPTYLHTPDNSLSNIGWDDVSYDAFYSNCKYVSSPLGVPEISITIGYHSKGSGIGMEITALNGQDQLLLDIAYTYTENFNPRVVPQTAPSLYEGTMSLAELLGQQEVPPVTEETTGTEATEPTETTATTDATSPEEPTEATQVTEEPMEETTPPTTAAPADTGFITAQDRQPLMLMGGLAALFIICMIGKLVKKFLSPQS